MNVNYLILAFLVGVVIGSLSMLLSIKQSMGEAWDSGYNLGVKHGSNRCYTDSFYERLFKEYKQ